MFADVLDQDELDETVILNNIDGSIGAAESDRAVTFPGPVQGLIVIARKPSNSFKTIKLNSTNPGHKVLDNMARTFAQVFLGEWGKSDRIDHDVRIARRGNVSTVKVASAPTRRIAGRCGKRRQQSGNDSSSPQSSRPSVQVLQTRGLRYTPEGTGMRHPAVWLHAAGAASVSLAP